MKRVALHQPEGSSFIGKFGLSTLLIVLFCGMAESSEGDGGKTNFRATLGARNDVVAISTVAAGSFSAKIIDEGTPDEAIQWELTYSGLEGDATQARLHLGRPGTSGGVIAQLCDSRPGNRTGADPCPARAGTLSGTIVTFDATPGVPGDGVTGVMRVDTVTFKPADQHVAGADNTEKVSQGIEAGEIGEVFTALRDQATYVNVVTTKFPNPGELRGDIN